MNQKNFVKQQLVHEGEGYQLYEGVNKMTDENIIIKEININEYKKSTCTLENLSQNIENTRQFSSSNLLKTYTQWKSSEDSICQVIERCDIDLSQLILQQYNLDPELAQEMQMASPGTIFEHDAILIMCQILEGLQDMYELGYVHRDINSHNILVKQLEEPPKNQMMFKNDKQLGMLEFKLNDFISMTDELDFDKFLVSEKLNVQPKEICTNQPDFFPDLNYASPQVLQQFLERECPYTSKTDVYSLGLVFYELLYGQLPFEVDIQEEISDEQRLDFKLQIMRNPLRIPPNKPITNITRDFLQKALAFNEEERLSLPEVFKHELFRNHFENLCKELRSSMLNQSKLQTKSAKVIQKLREYVEKTNKNLDELFNVVDTDGSGYLDENEFLVMLRKLDPEISQADSDSLFRRLDIRRQKQIERKEFKKIFIIKKLPKKLVKKVQELKEAIQGLGKTYQDIFDDYRSGAYQYFMDFNKMINELLPNYTSYDATQLFSFFSDNQIKPMISKKQFIEKLQISFENQKDFLFEDDIKEQALKQMNRLRENLREQKVDIMKLFYDNFSGFSDFIASGEIHAVLSPYCNYEKKNVKFIYKYFQYLHNNNNLINWAALAKALYPRSSKTKQEAMRLVDILKQIIKQNPQVYNFSQKFFNKAQIKELYQDAASLEEVDILFDYFDLDKDGFISQVELSSHLIEIDEKIKQNAHLQLKKLKKYIKRNEINVESLLSKNQSKLFDFEAFQELFPNLKEQESYYLYQYMDNDGNGRITFDEIKQILTEQDPRMVQQAQEIIKKLKITLQKKKIDVQDIFNENNIGEGKHHMNYVNRSILMDMFEKYGMTQDKVVLLSEIYGEPRTGMIHFEELLQLLQHSSKQQIKEKEDTKHQALEYIEQLKNRLNEKNITLKKMFDLYDLKGEGCLTYLQLKKMFIQNKIEVKDEELASICDFLDSDNDNEISYAEISRYIGSDRRGSSATQQSVELAQKAIEKLKKLLKNYDVDLLELFSNEDSFGDGQLNLQKFKSSSLFQEFQSNFTEAQITAMFQYIAQGEKTIHYKEFIREVI